MPDGWLSRDIYPHATRAHKLRDNLPLVLSLGLNTAINCVEVLTNTPAKNEGEACRDRVRSSPSIRETHLEFLMKLLDNTRIPIDLRTGNHVRIRRSWRTPLAGRSGVLSAIEPNDPYGTYLIRFEDGLQFRYERQDLELIVAPCTVPERVVRAFLRFARSVVPENLIGI